MVSPLHRSCVIVTHLPELQLTGYYYIEAGTKMLDLFVLSGWVKRIFYPPPVESVESRFCGFHIIYGNNMAMRNMTATGVIFTW